MSLKRWISAETEFVDIEDPFELESGETLPHIRIAYRTWGHPQPHATLVCHALTGSADADDWWADLFGPGRALDPDRDFIVCANVLGGCYGTTGPTSRADGAFEPYGGAFPTVTIRDMVRLQAILLDRLGVEVLDLVIGGSMGGMQALEWPLLFPGRVRAIAPIAVGPTQSAWGVALSEAQRQAIRADANFAGGRYSLGAGPTQGLAAARSMAMISYRSPHNFEVRFGRGEDEAGTYNVQSYLRYQGEKLVNRFDANTYLTLIDAMDSHDVGRGRGATEMVLGSIGQPALVISVSSDGLYPASEVATMAGHLPGAELVEIDAPHGHDAFLIEIDAVNDLLVDFINRHNLKSRLRLAVNE
ncbi:MAG: homoserine O-acetyltransferase [Acidimicrobiia bacterium]|nr:homoserine O-acetyltransferase [Acidimicrobiia bacterium]